MYGKMLRGTHTHTYFTENQIKITFCNIPKRHLSVALLSLDAGHSVRPSGATTQLYQHLRTRTMYNLNGPYCNKTVLLSTMKQGDNILGGNVCLSVSDLSCLNHLT